VLLRLIYAVEFKFEFHSAV